jgi:amino acid adenylation domain-containing protein
MTASDVPVQMGRPRENGEADMTDWTSFADILRTRARQTPDRLACRFLVGGTEPLERTYRDLDVAARAVAARLGEYARPGDRAILLFAPGTEYVEAFFGALYAGVIAVPAYPPVNQAQVNKLLGIIRDAKPSLVLSAEETLPALRDLVTGQEGLAVRWLATDGGTIDADGGAAPPPAADAIAFLQYTSGTTGAPKGVRVSHRNLLANSAFIARRFGHTADSSGVIWLPPYHDMGLIGGILQPVYVGFPVTLMSPLDFLHDPVRWLQAIGRYRATTSGGPNFAFDLCVRKIAPERRTELDLSSWSVAFTGAEPVREQTMRMFSDAFAESGFRQEAFNPCYGLAEATLMVTGGYAGQSPTVVRVDPDQLGHGTVTPRADGAGRELVGCGTAAPGHDVRIVGPSGRPLSDGEIGEIWVRGPGVADGYWSSRGRSAAFDGWCDEGRDGPYLRTGDQGFRWQGELFPTDRISDVVIIRGRNHSPGDIELTVAGCDSRLRPGCGAAFTVDSEIGARLCVVQEVDGATGITPSEAVALTEQIRAAVVEAHGLAVDTVTLIAKGQLPKTSSGKVRRRACRQALADGTFTAVGVAAQPAGLPDPTGPVEAVRAAAARVLGLPPGQVTSGRPLGGIGLDSVTALELRAAVQRDTGLLLPLPELLAGASCAELTAVAAVPGPGGPSAAGPALTSNESAMWFLQRLAPESRAYHLCHVVDVSGPLPADALDRAVARITARHSAFRTTFPSAGGQPRRVVGQPSVRLDHVDASGWDAARIDAELAALAEEPIDLATGPLWRLRHLAVDADRHVLGLVTHHIVADMWSLVLVFRELIEQLAGPAAPGPEAASMCHIAAAEQAYLGSPAAQADAAAWSERFADLSTRTELPSDRSPQTAGAGAGYRFAFDRATATGVRTLAQTLGVTPYGVLLGSLYALVHRYTGNDDLVVGMAASGRTEPDSHGVVGMLVNTIPVRCRVAAGHRFADVVAQTARHVADALAGQRYPFAELVRRLPHAVRDGGRNPLFDIVLAWQQAAGRDPIAAFALGDGRVEFADRTISAHPVPVQATPFDLTIDVDPNAGELTCQIRYNSGRWDRKTIEDLARHWRSLLAAGCASPESPIADLPLIDAAERRLLVDDLAPAPAEVSERALDQAVSQWAERTPRAIAVEDDVSSISYADLDERVSEGAAWLRYLGVGPEVTVGLLVRRSASFVVAALTVLRAGGTFVPLDPGHPADRLAAQVRDAGLLLVMTDREDAARCELLSSLGRAAPRFILVGEGMGHASPPPPGARPSWRAAPQHTAYVMFTSGTTGTPKGVSVPTAGVTNLLDDIARRAPIRPGEAAAWWTNAAFDLSVYEIFTALQAGARLIVVPLSVHSDGAALAEWLATQQITCAYVPLFAVDALAARAELAHATGRPLALRRLMVGVEPVPLPALRRIAAAIPAVSILNAYGPTEATIISALYDGDPRQCDGAMAPIGRAVRNNPLYLLDANLDPVPVGAFGEIYVGGVGVARGYLGHPAATAERYLPDPWVPGNRIYRTGDFGQWGQDRLLRFTGRRDSQVKLRGVRIELGEVEASLRRDGRVRAAVAAVREVGGNRVLIGYVAADQYPSLIPDLLAGCRSRLPAAMVPAAVVVLDALPMTESGKVDRAALPELELERPGYEPPRDDAEQLVVSVWSELLGEPQIGRYDDFFALGGHSLLAAQCAAELGRRLDRELPVALLFSESTVAGLARAVQGASQARGREIDAIPRAGTDPELLRAQLLALPDRVVAQLLQDEEPSL